MKPHGCLSCFTQFKSQTYQRRSNSVCFTTQIFDGGRWFLDMNEIYGRRSDMILFFMKEVRRLFVHIKAGAWWNKLHALYLCQLRTEALHCAGTNTVDHPSTAFNSSQLVQSAELHTRRLAVFYLPRFTNPSADYVLILMSIVQIYSFQIYSFKLINVSYSSTCNPK